MQGGSESSTASGAVPVIEGFSDLRVIGSGGFATVYSAHDVVLHRRVALKVLAVAHRDRRRFERECRILATLSEVEGVVPVHSATSSRDGRPVIVMKLYEGGSLSSVVRTSGPLSVGDTIRIGRRISGAVAQAHDRGVFHRDIKPDNVLFALDGAPALGDFGIATLDAVVNSTDTLGSLSPPHAPPERFVDSAEQSAAAGDVYSVGSTLYFCLSGEPPFGTAAQGGLAGLLRRVAEDPVPRLERPDVPDALFEVLRVALAKRPDGRFGSAAALLSALDDLDQGPVVDGESQSFGLITASAVPSATTSSPDLPLRATTGSESLFAPAPDVPDVFETDGLDPAKVEERLDDGYQSAEVADGVVVLGGAAAQADRNDAAVDGRDRTLPRAAVVAGLLLVAGAVASITLLLMWRGSDEPADGAAPGRTVESDLADEDDPVGDTGAVEDTPEGGIEAGSFFETNSESPLTTCTFTGSATISPGVAETSTGPQSLDLRNGSTISCVQESGGTRAGVFELHIDFEDLQYTTGSGSGTCAMAWADGTASTCAATVDLTFPTLLFNVEVIDGPFAQQRGSAVLEGWEPTFDEAGNAIVALVFEPTRLDWDPV